jgi:16S rRNA (uracil1498-N3)-methyltransferase
LEIRPLRRKRYPMAKRVLCSFLPGPERPVELDEAESRHVFTVLRLRTGDEVEALDGSGRSVRARVTRGAGGHGALLHFVAELGSDVGDPLPLVLELALLKGPAMEWVVEKSVELGIRSLRPVLATNSVVRLRGQAELLRHQERWQKIADQSLKQCGRLRRLEILPALPLAELPTGSGGSGAPSPRFWCDEASRGQAPELAESFLALHPGPKDELRLLVGPEGGWSAEEREALERLLKPGVLERCSLGPSVLRAETAAITAVSVAAALFRLIRSGHLPDGVKDSRIS